MVKIGSVIAEILLIWTNVARTNVVWTYVTITVKIRSGTAEIMITLSLWWWWWWVVGGGGGGLK